MKKVFTLLCILCYCLSFVCLANADDFLEVCGGLHTGMSIDEAKSYITDVLGIDDIVEAEEGIGFGDFDDPVTNRMVQRVNCITQGTDEVVAIWIAYEQYNDNLLSTMLIPDYNYLCDYVTKKLGRGVVENSYENNSIKNRYKGKDDQAVIEGIAWRYTTWTTRNYVVQVYINSEPFEVLKISNKNKPQIQIAIISALAAAAPSEQSATISGTSINVKANADVVARNEKKEFVAQIKKGDQLTITGYNTSIDMFSVVYQGKEAYVSGNGLNVSREELLNAYKK